jgi:hypothetical protein
VEANAVEAIGAMVLEADVAVFTVVRFLAGVRAHVNLQATGSLQLVAAHSANLLSPFDVNCFHMLENDAFGIEPGHES